MILPAIITSLMIGLVAGSCIVKSINTSNAYNEGFVDGKLKGFEDGVREGRESKK